MAGALIMKEKRAAASFRVPARTPPVIVEPLREQALTFDELSALTGFPAAKLNSHLTILELRGIIEKVPGGQYRSYA